MTVNDMHVSWYGEFEGNGAYPRLNRYLSEALERRGWSVFRNWYTDDEGHLPHYFVSSVYPPRSPTLDLPRTVAISTWEFGGRNPTPRSFINTFKNFDVVWAMCQQAADAFTASGADNVVAGRLGVDGDEFRPDLDNMVDLSAYGVPDDAFVILWVGGTDDRHGLDVALEAFERLPEPAWLVIKQHSGYPERPYRHERAVLIRDDFDSLAPLYRAAHVYLHSARAVAPSLPVMEAIACGVPVISTRLPAVKEYSDGLVSFVGATMEPMQHHLHFDAAPEWWQPDVDQLVKKLERKMLAPDVMIAWHRAIRFAQDWSWDVAAASLEGVLLG